MFVKLLLSQVDVKNRSVISIHVHVHGALLRRKADGTVLQGEGGAGCDVIPVLCLVFHVYKDGGGGDSSHGGALVEGWVGWDNVGAQI